MLLTGTHRSTSSITVEAGKFSEALVGAMVRVLVARVQVSGNEGELQE